MEKKHELIVYAMDGGKVIRKASFDTADEAWETQKKWLMEDADIFVERINDGYTMTFLCQQDILED